MSRAVLFVALSILKVSSAQLDRVPRRTRFSDSVLPSSLIGVVEENSFGHTKTKSNLRNSNGMQRKLQFSMSMSMPELSEMDMSLSIPSALKTDAPIGCMSDDDCIAGSSCNCWLNCKLCIVEFAPCGTCEIENDSELSI